MKESKITPMMQQFNEIKKQFADCIIFFRLGDFYEMFGEDAVICSQILDITLTSRNKAEDAMPMCGVPYHSAESYIAKLNQHGKKVAIAEQVGDTNGPGIVTRKVTRVVTPSTNLSDYCLEAKVNQFIAGLIFSEKKYGLCLCDVSTGELLVGEFKELHEVVSILSSMQVKELVTDAKLSENPDFYAVVAKDLSNVATSIHKVASHVNEAYSNLQKRFKVSSLGGFGLENKPVLVFCADMTMSYLESVLKTNLGNIKQIQHLQNPDYFELDRTTINNLEIFYSNNDFSKQGSLLQCIDCTRTAAGGRALRQRVIKPVKNIDVLRERLDLVEENVKIGGELEVIRGLLSNCYDLERLISKISLGICNPRELKMVQNSLVLVAPVKSFYEKFGGKVAQLSGRLKEIVELQRLLESALLDEPAVKKSEGQIFQLGYNEQVDELRGLLNEGKDYILELQRSEIEKTGIGNLKVSFNKVFGYYIEVSKGKVGSVPDYFIRKQTLTNSERYITPELKEYEEKVLNAEGELKVLEERLFDELLRRVLEFSDELFENAKVMAEIDLNVGLAYLAYHSDYCKPEMVEGKVLEIEEGRHPVIEKLIPMGSYVPNDSNFSEQYLKLITGPNMGGKSTYLRQNAIIVLMAQIGSFVPAKSARIGIVDQIFTRVGASDNISRGLSTFMVEMEETAFILRQATENSLLILDEIGRGTSTYDGVSLAWAILEYLHDSIKPRTLFATHYHELIELVQEMQNAENLSVAVEDDGVGNPVFLHKIQQGAVDKSYGVHVATMAGIPRPILDRANKLLIDLETKHRPHRKIKNENESKTADLKQKFESIDLNSLSPIEALQKLYEIKETYL